MLYDGTRRLRKYNVTVSDGPAVCRRILTIRGRCQKKKEDEDEKKKRK